MTRHSPEWSPCNFAQLGVKGKIRCRKCRRSGKPNSRSERTNSNEQNSPHFTVPQGSLPHLQTVGVHVRGLVKCFVHRKFFMVRICQHLVQPPIWRITPCRLSATAYSKYSQLPPISGGRSSIRNLRTRHAVVTGTHLSSNSRCERNRTLAIRIRDMDRLSRVNSNFQLHFRCICADMTRLPSAALSQSCEKHVPAQHTR
jgi:hypothetical protein